MIVKYRDKEWNVEGPCTVGDLAAQLDLKPNTVLALRDGRIIDDEEIVADTETIRFVAMISGG
ncbi:MAG: MoaD/ThiS family protein [Chloroflexi bacterium]|nr:MoaD/ThiS family protein [Chloroflexota bacterium]